MTEPRTARPRIRHLTSVHRFDDTRILRRQCASLRQAGYDVALVAGQPPTSPLDGVRIVGVGGPRNRFDRATRVAWRVLRAAWRERADIYHLHDPELLWVGLLLKLGGHRVVYDVHEDLPLYIMNKIWIPRAARRAISLASKAAERVGARIFDAVIAATPSIAERFPREKTVVVQNFPHVRIAQPPEPGPVESRRYAFAYVGGLTVAQGVREMVTVAANLGGDRKAVLAGWFDAEEHDVELELMASEGWKRVDYLGGVTHEVAINAIRNSVCGLVIDHPISNYLDSYSTKMFEYMACGVPVVCSDFRFWVRLISDADCGIAVNPFDPAAATAAIEKLLNDPDEARRLGENGRRAILGRYNWETEFVKLDALYDRLAVGPETR
jgi:glycosyltransferase involved in cell wall biosynthesis